VHSDEVTMSGRKNGIARHPSPCYIRRASAGHCSKPVNNPAGDCTVSCYLLGYRSYAFRCPADVRPTSSLCDNITTEYHAFKKAITLFSFRVFRFRVCKLANCACFVYIFAIYFLNKVYFSKLYISFNKSCI